MSHFVAGRAREMPYDHPEDLYGSFDRAIWPSDIDKPCQCFVSCLGARQPIQQLKSSPNFGAYRTCLLSSSLVSAPPRRSLRLRTSIKTFLRPLPLLPSPTPTFKILPFNRSAIQDTLRCEGLVRGMVTQQPRARESGMLSATPDLRSATVEQMKGKVRPNPIQFVASLISCTDLGYKDGD